MPTTINISVDVPKTYQLDVLKKQLTDYAMHLIAVSSSTKRHYKHEALCGVLAPERKDGEYVEEYLKEKYNV